MDKRTDHTVNWGIDTDIDIKQIRYALVIADCGSITRAAQLLFIAQPNLSRSVNELEQALGFPLFMRSKKGMALTRQGEYFLTGAKKVLERLSSLASECRSISKKSCHLSCVPSSLMINAILDLSREIKDYEIYCKEYQCVEFFQNVVNGVSDAGFIIFAIDMKEEMMHYLDKKGLSYHSAGESPSYLVFSENSPFLSQAASLWDMDFSSMELMMNVTYFDPIGIQYTAPPYPLPKAKSIRRGFGRAANLEMLDTMDNIAMLGCRFHPRSLERNHLVSIPFHEEICVYEYGYIIKKDRVVEKELQSVLDQITERLLILLN